MPNDPALSLFTAALGLTPPWKVIDIDFDGTAKRIDFRIGYDRGSRFACPTCGAAEQAVHDRRTRTFATLECQLLHRRSLRDHAEARQVVFELIEGWYNPHRRHSAIAYLSPVNYERRCLGEPLRYKPLPLH